MFVIKAPRRTIVALSVVLVTVAMGAVGMMSATEVARAHPQAATKDAPATLIVHAGQPCRHLSRHERQQRARARRTLRGNDSG